MSGLMNETTRALKRWSSYGVGLSTGLSCLPNHDLSSYSSGRAELDRGGVLDSEAPLGEDVVVGAMPEAAPADGPVASLGDEACNEGCAPPDLSLALDAGASALTPALLDAVAPTSGDAGFNDTGGDAGPCGRGALLGPDERCFALVTTPSTWSEAQLACQERGNGWDLAVIREPEQNAWLVEISGDVIDAWVGASDLESEGDWRWVGDEQAFWIGPGDTGASVGGAYENWNRGENPEPNGSAGSNCLRLRASGGWADIACDEAFASLCEGPPPP